MREIRWNAEYRKSTAPFAFHPYPSTRCALAASRRKRETERETTAARGCAVRGSKFRHYRCGQRTRRVKRRFRQAARKLIRGERDTLACGFSGDLRMDGDGRGHPILARSAECHGTVAADVSG